MYMCTLYGKKESIIRENRLKRNRWGIETDHRAVPRSAWPLPSLQIALHAAPCARRSHLNAVTLSRPQVRAALPTPKAALFGPAQRCGWGYSSGSDGGGPVDMDVSEGEDSEDSDIWSGVD